MNIGLDFDGVVTAEPVGFRTMVHTMRQLGHKVYIVTMRYPSECIADPLMVEWASYVDGIIPTSRQAKRAVAEIIGLKIHIWIDDHPEAVLHSAELIWGKVSPEGMVVIVNQATGEHVPTEMANLVSAEQAMRVKSKLILPQTQTAVEQALV